MSAALKSYVPRPVPSRLRAATSSAQPTRPAAPPVVLPTSTTVGKPNQALQVLTQLQTVSSVLAGALVALTLVSYGTSVYISRQLSQANQQLSRLQRHEQQLTTANEVLKNHLAEQAIKSEVGFQPPQPNSVIFLRPTHRAAPANRPNPEHPTVGRFRIPPVDVPLGY
jgi:hypothetical protein